MLYFLLVNQHRSTLPRSLISATACVLFRLTNKKHLLNACSDGRGSVWRVTKEGSASIHFESCSADRRHRIIEPHRCVARLFLALARFLENFFFSLFSPGKVQLGFSCRRRLFHRTDYFFS